MRVLMTLIHNTSKWKCSLPSAHHFCFVNQSHYHKYILFPANSFSILPPSSWRASRTWWWRNITCRSPRSSTNWWRSTTLDTLTKEHWLNGKALYEWPPLKVLRKISSCHKGESGVLSLPFKPVLLWLDIYVKNRLLRIGWKEQFHHMSQLAFLMLNSTLTSDNIRMFWKEIPFQWHSKIT